MNEKCLEQNLELWAHHHPKEVIWLSYTDCDHLKFCKTKNNQINLRFERNYYHSNSDPIREAERWFTKLDLSHVDVLYVYGVGLGYYYEASKKWLRKSSDHHLVFLEDDLAVIHRLFETKRGTQLLQDDQVHLHFFSEVNGTNSIFCELYWKFMTQNIAFSASRSYEKNKKEKCIELQHQLHYDASIKSGLLEEYLQYGVAFYRNFYSNMLNLPGSFLGNALFGKFKDVPAIICGAGPSLQKNVALLKKLKNQAIVFAGSSALNALSAAGIQPHFGAGIDPNSLQEGRLSQIPDLNFPFFYRNRIFPKALQLVQGPKLYIMGSGGYDTSEWFEKKFEIKGETIEEGHNVVNFCLEIAHAMKCNPIIFVGLDLAYTGMQAYTAGVVKDPSFTEQEISSTTALKKTDIYGNEVFTEWKWVAESKWIADYAKNNPDITVINATEGGMGFPDVPNQSLKQVVSKHLQHRYQIKSRINKQIQQGKMPRVNRKKIVEAMEELREGLTRCVRDLQVLSDENEEVKKQVKKKKVSEYFQTGKAALIESELAEEPAFTYVLQIFNAVYSRVLQCDLRKIYDPQTKVSDAENALYRLELNSKKYTFLKNVAQVNIELINFFL